MPNMEKIIQQGAEAVIIKKSLSVLVKRRTKKSYRLPLLDEKIRKQRTKREFSLLQKASKLIPIPKIIKLDEKNNLIAQEPEIARELKKRLEEWEKLTIIAKQLKEVNLTDEELIAAREAGYLG